MSVTIDVNLGPVLARLKTVQKQIPFAASQALNDVAKHVARKALPESADKTFEGGASRWTKMGFAYRTKGKGARKRNLEQGIFIRPMQATYMKFMISPSHTLRTPKKRPNGKGKGKTISVPTKHARRTQRGHIATKTWNTYIDQANNKKNPNSKFFRMDKERVNKNPNRYAGIFERMGGKKGNKVRRVVAYKDSTKYPRVYFQYYKKVDFELRNKSRGFRPRFLRRLRAALKTKK